MGCAGEMPAAARLCDTAKAASPFAPAVPRARRIVDDTYCRTKPGAHAGLRRHLDSKTTVSEWRPEANND